MSAGELRHRVDIQSPLSTQDEAGQPSTSWVTVASRVPARVKFASGLSAIKSGADVSVSRASIKMRQRAANSGQRVVFGDTIFSVSSVQPDVRGAYVDLVCEALNVQTA